MHSNGVQKYDKQTLVNARRYSFGPRLHHAESSKKDEEAK